jgi:hypothetical protein
MLGNRSLAYDRRRWCRNPRRHLLEINMPRQDQPSKQSPADQFSDPEMEQLQRYGQALGGGVTPFDEEVERALTKLHPGEAQAKKMRAAQTGGSEGLGPTEAEAALAKQRGMLEQQTGAAGQQQAMQAQGSSRLPKRLQLRADPRA